MTEELTNMLSFGWLCKMNVRKKQSLSRVATAPFTQGSLIKFSTIATVLYGTAKRILTWDLFACALPICSGELLITNEPSA